MRQLLRNSPPKEEAGAPSVAACGSPRGAWSTRPTECLFARPSEHGSCTSELLPVIGLSSGLLPVIPFLPDITFSLKAHITIFSDFHL